MFCGPRNIIFGGSISGGPDSLILIFEIPNFRGVLISGVLIFGGSNFRGPNFRGSYFSYSWDPNSNPSLF